MKINFDFLKWEFGFILSARKKRIQPIAGITNRTKDGYYVVFLDYDEMPLEWLKGELESIQQEFNLSEIYVFSSSKDHYHAVSFDKLTREEYEKLLYRSSCDSNYKKIPWTFGKRLNTLRATEKQGKKIKLAHIIKAPENRLIERYKSLAHAQFFKNFYNLKIPIGDYDKNSDLIIATYKI